MTSKVPEDRQYTASHEWVRTEGEELVIGITDHAQGELTDIVFVDLPAVGRSVAAGESVLVLESVKTVADVYAPAPGTIVAANADLKGQPGLINQDPYGKGWIYRLRPSSAPRALLSAADYAAKVAAGAH
ncbi:MAG TPA: glycine cleavage system protein GcvH [Thermoplasmata archaeon]|nr:glycine cleavage system protein GcvH [Thermoplasmata archaeon]